MKPVNTKLLKEFNKWRRGKGKKYQTPGVPFDTKQIGEEIDKAIAYCDALNWIGFAALDSIVHLATIGMRAKKAVVGDDVKFDLIAISALRRLVRRLDCRVTAE